jgi:MtN3 and saliva related transmembrane protein
MSSTSSSLAVIAGSWGVLMALSPLLQIRAMVRRRSSAGVSVGYLSVLAIGFTLWLAYGLSLGNAALIITNIVSLGVGLATIAVARRLRPGKQRSSPS